MDSLRQLVLLFYSFFAIDDLQGKLIVLAPLLPDTLLKLLDLVNLLLMVLLFDRS